MNGSDAKVRVNKRKGEALNILDQVPKNSEAFWVLARLNLAEATNLTRAEQLVLVANKHFQLLHSYVRRLGPFIVSFGHDWWLADDSYQLFDNYTVHVDCKTKEKLEVVKFKLVTFFTD